MRKRSVLVALLFVGVCGLTTSCNEKPAPVGSGSEVTDSTADDSTTEVDEAPVDEPAPEVTPKEEASKSEETNPDQTKSDATKAYPPTRDAPSSRDEGRGSSGESKGVPELGERSAKVVRRKPRPRTSKGKSANAQLGIPTLGEPSKPTRKREADERPPSTKKKLPYRPRRSERPKRSVPPPPAPPDPREGLPSETDTVEPPSLDGFENRAVTSEVIAQPMTETSVDPLSTFAVDVDTGAYTLARARLREGYPPREKDVRIEEFLNYFHYDYPAPKEGAFSVHLEAAPDPFAAGRRHLMRVGVQGREVADDERPPAHLTFVIDVSGSMFGPDKLGLAREALELATRRLRPDDTLSIVTYARGAEVVLWPSGASERDSIMGAIGALEPGGSSALDEGLDLAYRVASTHFYAGQINRVVLLSDGRANVGATRPERVLRRVRAGVEDGVMLSTIGFGARAFNDRMMEQLADNGNGNYFFVDSFREAQRVFADRLCGTLHAIARDVKIQVEFNPDAVERHRLVGYENRRLAHQQFRDDSVDAGEIGAGHSVTALYEIELVDEPASSLATVRIRHKEPDADRASELDFKLYAEELVGDVRKASPDFEFAAAVALFAEVLRGDEEGSAARLSLVQEIASEGITDRENQPDRVEFVELVGEAKPYFED